jgi:predicted MFS family arabinose efflux permease
MTTPRHTRTHTSQDSVLWEQAAVRWEEEPSPPPLLTEDTTPARRAFGTLRAEVFEGLGLSPDGEERSAWVTLKQPNFRLFFGGAAVSDFGTWLQNTAQALLVYRLSHSVFAVGLVSCAQFASPLLLGPAAGVVADRFGARKTLLFTQVAAAAIAFALAGLVFTHAIEEWTLATGALVTGLAFTFALPARTMLFGRMVPEHMARDAYVMDGVSYNLGRALAPPAAIAIALTVGYQWVFVANGLSFVAFVAALRRARPREAEPRVRSKARAGFLITAQEPYILLLLAMVAAVTVADDPVLVLGPALTSQLHVAVGWSGGFIAALGAGSVLGSARKLRYVPSRRLAATALACLGVCMVLFVSIPWVWATLIAALGAGVSCLLANSMTKTLLMEAAGAQRVGSVMAVWAIAWTGSKPVASLLDGWLAGQIGIQATGFLLAVPAFLPLAYVMAKPQVMKLRTRLKPETEAC